MIHPDRAAALLLTLALAAGCVRPPAPEAQASAAERAACRARADQVYALQNRDEVYRGDIYVSSIRDTPFAGAGLTSVTSAGLGNQYARNQTLLDCLRGRHGTVGAAPAGPEPQDAQPVPTGAPAGKAVATEPLAEPAPGNPLTVPPAD